jgi:hypothetical protein
MGNVTLVFMVRDGQSSPPGERKTGLTPTWVHLKRLSDGTNITPTPTISEIGQGQYKFTYDPETSGEAAGQIDAGSGLTAAADRYVDVVLTRERSRLVYSLPSETPGADGGLAIADGAGQVAAKITEYGTEMEPETRILVTPENKLAADTQGRVSLNLTQTIPATNTAQTVGDALNAARAQGFGKWVLSGTSLTLFAADGTTVVRTFTLDSATAPTQRS